MHVDPGTLRESFFEGRVCEGDETRVLPMPGYAPCENPIENVTATITNSCGQTDSTRTDMQGFYSLPEMSFYGTEDDVVTYEVDGFGTQRVSHVLYDVATSGTDAGVLVFLAKLRHYP